MQIFAFGNEWEFDPTTDRYGWGRSVDGYVGVDAAVERIDTALFDERVLWITAGKNEHFLRLDIPATPPTTDLPWKGDS